MQLPSEDGAFVTTTPGHGGVAQAASSTQTMRTSFFMAMVPVVRIERTTYRLQGGCSTPELNRQSGPQRKKPRCTPDPKLCAYLIRRNVGLPPEGLVGGERGVVGAGSDAGGRVLEATLSVSALTCTPGLAPESFPSMSKVMPWPVSRA